MTSFGDVEVETPLGTMTAKRIAGKKSCYYSVLRAGAGMVGGILETGFHLLASRS